MRKSKRSVPDKFILERDTYGFAAGISLDGYWVLQLDRGTVRNEECAEWIVDRLNGSNAERIRNEKAK